MVLIYNIIFLIGCEALIGILSPELDQSDVTWDNDLFSIGKSSFFREISCNEGSCLATFHIHDSFADPLDFRVLPFSDGFDLPNAQPYDINYKFTKEKTCP